VLSDFPGLCVLDGGACEVGLESTVIKVVDGNIIRILRPGKICQAQLEKFAPVQIGFTEISAAPEAPGMKYKHYAPSAEVHLIYSASEVPLEARFNTRVVLLAFDDFNLDFKGERMSLGSREDLEEASRRLFGYLRRCDDLEASEVYVDVGFVQDCGIGQALWNRISKAASKR
jgi:L-threonylcarbamoyladenylate synthase